jgi:hypothetical protein
METHNPASSDFAWGASRMSLERPHTPFPEVSVELIDEPADETETVETASE